MSRAVRIGADGGYAGSIANPDPATRGSRKLTQWMKWLVFAMGRGRCGYCGVWLELGFSNVDHLSEDCLCDMLENLVGCCCNCHARKTRMVHDGSDWTAMHDAVGVRRDLAIRAWQEAAKAASGGGMALSQGLPSWLVERLRPSDLVICADEAAEQADQIRAGSLPFGKRTGLFDHGKVNHRGGFSVDQSEANAGSAAAGPGVAFTPLAHLNCHPNCVCFR